jgi:translocation and assembly module TamA
MHRWRLFQWQCIARWLKTPRKNSNQKLIKLSAFLVFGACLFTSAHSQTPTQRPAKAFEIEIEAPTALQALLKRHLTLYRYEAVDDLSEAELARLLDAAKTNAAELLATQGFFSPNINVTLATHAEPDLARKKVLIQVIAGNAVMVDTATITFQSDIAASRDPAVRSQRDQIESLWVAQRGQPFSQVEWDRVKSQALRVLTEKRFLTGKIESSLADVQPQTERANVSMTLDSGPAFFIGPIQPIGLERYDPLLVTRLARLVPGTPYDQNQLIEAQQRLTDSGYFDAAYLALDPNSNPTAAVVAAQVREAHLQKVVLGLGASTDSGFRLSAQHTHLKLPGLHWKVSSKLSMDRNTSLLSSEQTSQPDDFGTQWVTSQLFQRQTSAGSDVLSQRYRVGKSQTGESIDRNYYLQYDRATTATGESVATADGVTVNYAWTQRNFDSLPFPSKGYGLGAELAAGVTLDSARQPFLRAQLRWLGVLPLAVTTGATAGRSSRLAARAELGGVVARDGTQLPSSQLFLTGGDTTVRGYAFRSIGQDTAGSVTPGRYLANGSLEWQRPLVMGGKASDWESTVFIDAGAVADQPGQMKPKVGVGAGARWRSPVGPLQIDLAYGVQVQQLRLHLSVGFNF